MNKVFHVALVAGIVVAVTAAMSERACSADAPQKGGQRVFELRTYVANPGKLDDLHKRFRDHTCRLFKRHGIEVIGFWTPSEGEGAKTTLIYMVAFPSAEAQKKSWAAFRADPEWQKAKAESEKEGVLVKEIKSENLNPTDYSPLR